MSSNRGLADQGDDGLGLDPYVTAMRSAKRQKNFSYDQYTLAWVCALHLELSAAMIMLDEVHDELPHQPHDTNTYGVGRIGNHNVVIACLPAMQYGTVKAATVVAHMIRTFPSIEMTFMVGIGGGVPSPSHDIRLGDVVVGTRVMPYDLSKVTEDGLERTDPAKPLHPRAGTLVSTLRARHEIDGRADFHAILQEQSEKHPAFGHPNIPDRLFHAKYSHETSARRFGSISFILNETTPGSSECDRCAPSQIVRRAIRGSEAPEVHYGAVASGNQVMKDGISRDQYARDLSVICFEMESAGLMDFLPCIPIRGICDYSDTHKNKHWQKYAALVAASFAKDVIHHLPTNEAMGSREAKTNQSLPISVDMKRLQRRQQLLDSLKFETIDTRKLAISDAHGETCQWILHSPEYMQWLDHRAAATHRGFFWIRGKPGTGKSTLMKFIYGQMRKKDQRGTNLTTSFFFHAQGSSLSRSIFGMYRSLLFQLLEGFPDLQQLLDDLDIFPRSQIGDLSRSVLESLLQDAVMRLGTERSLTCYIDALDECDEQQAIEMVRSFEDLEQRAAEDHIHFKICFSSRHYPYIDIRFGLRLTLEEMPDHTAALTEYIQSNLRVKNPLLQELRERLLQKSAGVFLWVKLMVDILNNERSRDGLAMRKRLSEIPEGLAELFGDLIRRDPQNMEDFRLCILWLLCAKRPLSPIEYHHALWAGLAMEDLADSQPPESNAKDPDESVENSVVHSSKGLAEITKSTHKDKATVQLIHESVRDFLVKDGELYDLWPELVLDWESAGHERLKLCCSFYLSGYASSRESGQTKRPGLDGQTRPTPSMETSPDFPLLAYASQNMLYHADGAAKAYSQVEFITSLDLGQWVAIYNAHAKFQTRRYPPTPDLLYVLADQGHANLVRCWLEANPSFNALQSMCLNGHKYKHPLFAALACGHKDTIAALLGSHSTVVYGCDIAQVTKNRAAFERTSYRHGSPLTWAVEQNLPYFVQWLLEHGVDPEDHLDKLRSMDNLASIYLGKAVELLESGVDTEDHSDKLRSMGNLTSTYLGEGATTTITSFQESASEPIDDTTATVYSDAPSMTTPRRERCISDLVDQLANETRFLTVGQETQTRVSEILPELLRAFALMIGFEAPSKMHRDVMVFVHKSRREIAAAFADMRFSQEEDSEEKGLADLDVVDWKELVSNWIEHEDFEQALPEMQDDRSNHSGTIEERSLPEPRKATEERDESDEPDEGEDLTEAWLQEYREFIFKTPAFKWLLARLRNELRLIPMAPHSKEAIGKEILSALPSSRIVSKKISSQRYSATFELEWDVFGFFEAQRYSKPPHEVFEGVITLTGSSVDAQGATCAQYLEQTWPSTVEDIVALIKEILQGKGIDPPQRKLSDGTTLRVFVRNSKFLAEVYGTAVTIAEVGEQLAWLGAALRNSTERSGLVYCTPTITTSPRNSSLASQPDLQSHSNGIAYKIGFTIEKISASLVNGQCWQAVFRNPVIVRGYPIPQRAEWNTGLEIPLSIMAVLARAPMAQHFKHKLCLKGFSTMLVPVRRSGDILCWHLLYTKDGSRISYLDNDMDQKHDIASLDLLQRSRHVLGWCSEEKLLLGSSVKHSMLPKIKADGTPIWEPILRGRAIKGDSKVFIGRKDSPEPLLYGYAGSLQFLKARFVLLWDKDDKRGWLVSGIIALLLALRAFLAGPYRSVFQFKSEEFQEPDTPLTAMSAFEILNNSHNQNLCLYREDIRLKSKIEDLYGVFELLIERQGEIAKSYGTEQSTQPRANLVGWDFEEVAGVDQNTLHPRMAKIEPHGKGWVDFTRSIQAVTLFGCGFGDIIQPAVETCSRWASLPTGRYYIAVCVSDLYQVFRQHGLHEDRHIRLSDDLIWNTPAKYEFCHCPPGSDRDDCEPVQTAFPWDLVMSEQVNPRGNELPDHGALIFGHSSRFSWIWDDSGDPRKGFLGDPASNSPKDSGIGQSLMSPEPGQVLSSSNLDTRSMASSTDAYNDSVAASGQPTILQTYPKRSYKVGILCALSKELKAVRALFDESHNSPEGVPSDPYVFGKMGHHMVVATCLGNYGTNAAASAASGMKDHFKLPFCLLVGIGGGVPSQHNDIRLGDVVVGTTVVQYDLGQMSGGKFEMKELSTWSPPTFLMQAIRTKIESDPRSATDKLSRHLKTISDKLKEHRSYSHPGLDQDVLFQPCSGCGSSQEPCAQESQHSPSRRDPRLTFDPKVHYGRIASGNRVIKDAGYRDVEGGKLKVMCFEMEAAGVANALPCLVIRGICDYCDAHKNDIWQEYAAATAAAYAKLFLTVVSAEIAGDNWR